MGLNTEGPCASHKWKTDVDATKEHMERWRKANNKLHWNLNSVSLHIPPLLSFLWKHGFSGLLVVLCCELSFPLQSLPFHIHRIACLKYLKLYAKDHSTHEEWTWDKNAWCKAWKNKETHVITLSNDSYQNLVKKICFQSFMVIYLKSKSQILS